MEVDDSSPLHTQYAESRFGTAAAAAAADDVDPKTEYHLLSGMIAQHEGAGNDMQALALREQALLCAKKTFGEESIEVRKGCESFIIRCNQAAVAALSDSDFDVAFDLLRKAEILSDQSGCLRNDPEPRLRCRAVTLNNFGLFYRHRGQNHAALNYLEQALEIEQTDRNRNSENPAATLLNLCAVLSSMGKYSTALSYAKQALAWLTKHGAADVNTSTTAPSHGEMLAVAHHAAGCQYEGLREYVKAAEEFSAAVVASRALGDTNPLYSKAFLHAIQKARASGKVPDAQLPRIPPDTRPLSGRRASLVKTPIRPASSRPGSGRAAAVPSRPPATARPQSSSASFLQGAYPVATSKSVGGGKSASAASNAWADALHVRPHPPSRPSTAVGGAAAADVPAARKKRPNTAGMRRGMGGSNAPPSDMQAHVPHAPMPPWDGTISGGGAPSKRPRPPSAPSGGSGRMWAARQAYNLVYRPPSELATDLSSKNRAAFDELESLSRRSVMRLGTTPQGAAAPGGTVAQHPEADATGPPTVPGGGAAAHPPPYGQCHRNSDTADYGKLKRASEARVSPQKTAMVRERTPEKAGGGRRQTESGVSPRTTTRALRFSTVEGAGGAPQREAASPRRSPAHSPRRKNTWRSSPRSSIASTPRSSPLGRRSVLRSASRTPPGSPRPATNEDPSLASPQPSADVAMPAQQVPDAMEPIPQPLSPLDMEPTSVTISPSRDGFPESPVTGILGLSGINVDPFATPALPFSGAVTPPSQALAASGASASIAGPPVGSGAVIATAAEQHAVAAVEDRTRQERQELMAKIMSIGSQLNQLQEDILASSEAGGRRVRVEREKERQRREAAAIGIQRLVRGHLGRKYRALVYESRRAEMEARAREAAARALRAKVTSGWRRAYHAVIAANRLVSLYNLRIAAARRVAATSIQMFARSYVSELYARTMYVRRLARAARKCQTLWRGYGARLTFRRLLEEWREKEKIKRFSSAARIQIWWRRTLHYRHKERVFQQQWADLVRERKPGFAAQRIQLWYRWLRFEHAFVPKVLQISFEKRRAIELREAAEQLKVLQLESAHRIQQAFRNYVARRQLGWLRRQDLERKIAYLEHAMQDHATRVLQAFARVVHAVRRSRRRRAEAAEFAVLRAWKQQQDQQRAVEAESMRILERAAMVIQRVWRGYHLRKQRWDAKVAALLEWETAHAPHATNIQKVYRGFVSRQRTAVMVTNHRRDWGAAAAIQRCFRGHRARRISTTLRTARSTYDAERVAADNLRDRVLQVQAAAGACLSTIRVAKLRVVYHDKMRVYRGSALIIGRAWRCRAARQEFASRRNAYAEQQREQLEHQMAACIQRAFRNVWERRRQAALRAARVPHAVVIQQFARAWRARGICGELQMRCDARARRSASRCAVALQAAARSAVAQRWAMRQRAVRIIQMKARTKLCMRPLHAYFTNVQDASLELFSERLLKYDELAAAEATKRARLSEVLVRYHQRLRDVKRLINDVWSDRRRTHAAADRGSRYTRARAATLIQAFARGRLAARLAAVLAVPRDTPEESALGYLVSVCGDYGVTPPEATSAIAFIRSESVTTPVPPPHVATSSDAHPTLQMLREAGECPAVDVLVAVGAEPDAASASSVATSPTPAVAVPVAAATHHPTLGLLQQVGACPAVDLLVNIPPSPEGGSVAAGAEADMDATRTGPIDAPTLAMLREAGACPAVDLLFSAGGGGGSASEDGAAAAVTSAAVHGDGWDHSDDDVAAAAAPDLPTLAMLTQVGTCPAVDLLMGAGVGITVAPARTAPATVTTVAVAVVEDPPVDFHTPTLHMLLQVGACPAVDVLIGGAAAGVDADGVPSPTAADDDSNGAYSPPSVSTLVMLATAGACPAVDLLLGAVGGAGDDDAARAVPRQPQETDTTATEPAGCGEGAEVPNLRLLQRAGPCAALDVMLGGASAGTDQLAAVTPVQKPAVASEPHTARADETDENGATAGWQAKPGSPLDLLTKAGECPAVGCLLGAYSSDATTTAATPTEGRAHEGATGGGLPPPPPPPPQEQNEDAAVALVIAIPVDVDAAIRSCSSLALIAADFDPSNPLYAGVAGAPVVPLSDSPSSLIRASPKGRTLQVHGVASGAGPTSPRSAASVSVRSGRSRTASKVSSYSQGASADGLGLIAGYFSKNNPLYEGPDEYDMVSDDGGKIASPLPQGLDVEGTLGRCTSLRLIARDLGPDNPLSTASVEAGSPPHDDSGPRRTVSFKGRPGDAAGSATPEKEVHPRRLSVVDSLARCGSLQLIAGDLSADNPLHQPEEEIVGERVSPPRVSIQRPHPADDAGAIGRKASLKLTSPGNASTGSRRGSILRKTSVEASLTPSPAPSLDADTAGGEGSSASPVASTPRDGTTAEAVDVEATLSRCESLKLVAGDLRRDNPLYSGAAAEGVLPTAAPAADLPTSTPAPVQEEMEEADPALETRGGVEAVLERCASLRLIAGDLRDDNPLHIPPEGGSEPEAAAVVAKESSTTIDAARWARRFRDIVRGRIARRARAAQRAAEASSAQQREAATVIQAAVRGMLARQAYALLRQRHTASRTIYWSLRMVTCVVEFRRQRAVRRAAHDAVRREEAALVIQTLYRCWAGRRRVRQLLSDEGAAIRTQMEEDAARIIQKALRENKLRKAAIAQ